MGFATLTADFCKSFFMLHFSTSIESKPSKVATVSAVPVYVSVVKKGWKTEISFSETFNQTFDGRYGKQWANSIAKTKAIDVKKPINYSKLLVENSEFVRNTTSDESISDLVDPISPLATDKSNEAEDNCSSKKKSVSTEIECFNRLSGSELEQASSKMLDQWKLQNSRNYCPKPSLMACPISTPTKSLDSQSIQSNENCLPEVFQDQVKNEMNNETEDLSEADSEDEIESLQEPDNELMMESLAELLDLDYEDILRINRLPSGDYDIIFKQ